MIPIKKAQTWSIDVLMAVFVFLTIFILFIGIIGTMSNNNEELRLADQSEFITAMAGSERLVSSPEKGTGFIIDNKIDMKSIQEIAGMNIDELRSKFGVRDDFCIYFKDAEGKLVKITDETTGITYNGIGSPNATINDIPCGPDGGRVETPAEVVE